MTGGLSKNFHGVGIGPLSKILAVKSKKLLYSKEKLKVQDSLGPYWQKIFFALDFVLLARILYEANKD